MTEHQIEHRAERMMDALDRQYLSTNMTKDTYDILVRQIDDWAFAQYYAARLSDANLIAAIDAIQPHQMEG